METQCQAIDLDVFQSALRATAENRLSLDALRDKEKIIQTIQADAAMRQRWDRYCKEYYYANGIPFDEVIEALTDLLKDNLG